MSNLHGALWMTAAMAFYAVLDSFMKLSTRTIPVAQVLVILGLAGFAIFAVAARRQGLVPLPARVFRGPALLRGFCDAGASALFIVALSTVDLTLFTTIIQANPLLVVLGAALFLGEKVGWRRWLAIATGLGGVLIVLRPTGDSFSAASLLVVAGVVLQSSRDVVTRAISRDIHSLQLSAASFVALALMGLAMGILRQTPPVLPEGKAWFYLIGACFMVVPATYAIIASMRVGEVSFVAPFRYTRIVFGLGIGVLVFGEDLDSWTIIGALVIAGSGLYSFWREAQLRRASQGASKGL